MRDAEEVARDMYAAAEQTYDDLRELGPKMGPGKMRERMIYAIATHLRARDAEVRADERAKVLGRNAVLRAWTNAGPRPDVHRRSKDVVRKTMPVLARALDEDERGLT